MRTLLLFLSLLLIATCSVVADDTIRVCTWNLLNYSIENEDGRTPLYKKVLDQIDPDILVVQDIESEEAALKFLVEVLGTEGWAYSEYNPGTEANDMLYFNQVKVDFYGSTVLPTDEHDVTEHLFRVKDSRDTLRVFSCNFREGESEEDRIIRDSQAQVITGRIRQIREWNPPLTKAFVLGSFHLISSSEEAAKRLHHVALGYLYDPFYPWLPDDTTYAHIYTQSTRTTGDIACGGGIGGGINKRYDLIFHTGNMTLRNYIPDSYTVFGNDGKDRLNFAIDNPPNMAVSADMAAALRCASDHLPVFADYWFSVTTSVDEQEEFGKSDIRIYPMPVTNESVIELKLPADRISIIDILGREVYSIAVEGRSRVSVPPLAPGVYLCRVGQITQLFHAE